MAVPFQIPHQTPSLTNTREHWRRRAKRAQAQRRDARLLTHASLSVGDYVWLQAAGGRITLTRVCGGSKLLDDDNLPPALKSIRDGIADAIVLDDGDRRLTWVYLQERGRVPCVRVLIEVNRP